MFMRRSVTVKYVVAASIAIAFYCEWIVYKMPPLFWDDLQCSTSDTTCTKVLFIADPQIQGDYAVPKPLSYLFNWDSDRYLRSTFKVVIEHYKPNVLVYLGDLMDEGSICTIPQFHTYVGRLANIFDVKYPVMQVWLPGDNDIGGENEPIRQIKIKEFEKIFDQPTVLNFKNITFIKVNGITHSYPKESELLDLKSKKFKIVLSHYPITVSTVFGEQVNKDLQPSIYFCAHDHVSKYVKQTRELKNRLNMPLNYGDSMLRINFTDASWLYEVFVPTCSYRMGTSKIGYGAAVLENNNQVLRYTVFWSPKRFPYLFIYLGLLIFIIIYFCVFCSPMLYRRTKKVFRRSDKVPLLNKI